MKLVRLQSRALVHAIVAVVVAIGFAASIALFTGFSHDPGTTRREIKEARELVEGRVLTESELDRLLAGSTVAPPPGDASLLEDVQSAIRSSGWLLFPVALALFALMRPRAHELAAPAFVAAAGLLLIGSRVSAIALVLASLAYGILWWLLIRWRHSRKHVV